MAGKHTTAIIIENQSRYHDVVSSFKADGEHGDSVDIQLNCLEGPNLALSRIVDSEAISSHARFKDRILRPFEFEISNKREGLA